MGWPSFDQTPTRSLVTGWPRNQHAKTASAPMPGLTLSTRKYSNCGLTTKRNKQEEMMLNQLVFQTGKYAFLSPPCVTLKVGCGHQNRHTEYIRSVCKAWAQKTRISL